MWTLHKLWEFRLGSLWAALSETPSGSVPREVSSAWISEVWCACGEREEGNGNCRNGLDSRCTTLVVVVDWALRVVRCKGTGEGMFAMIFPFGQWR
jgi:hypothetical protein